MAHALDQAATAPVPRGDIESVPRQLGQWELVRRIGSGGLSHVYQARPAGNAPTRSASYAVKLLRPEWQTDPQAIQLFHREAMVGRAISHPHLITVLTAHLHEPPYYLVMPLLRGATLAGRIANGQLPALPAALWIVRQTAEALGALHGQGWLHGDIKPSNLFVSPESHVTVLDLGFCRRMTEPGSAIDRPLLGTLGYMAPETITSSIAADARSDLYSLGITLFETLTGKLPLKASTLSELAEQHRHDSLPSMRAFAPQLPPSVARLVEKLLAKNPIRRPQTAGELIHRLISLEIASLTELVPAAA